MFCRRLIFHLAAKKYCKKILTDVSKYVPTRYIFFICGLGIHTEETHLPAGNSKTFRCCSTDFTECKIFLSEFSELKIKDSDLWNSDFWRCWLFLWIWGLILLHSLVLTTYPTYGQLWPEIFSRLHQYLNKSKAPHPNSSKFILLERRVAQCFLILQEQPFQASLS